MTRSRAHLLLTATLLGTVSLSACGARGQAAATRTTPKAVYKLPATEELESRVANAFRVGVRQLSIASGVGGETSDIGQPVQTGLLDGVRCKRAGDDAATCIVHWADVLGHRLHTPYAIVPARLCFNADADPQLPPIRDVTAQAQAESPLQELSGASRC